MSDFPKFPENDDEHEEYTVRSVDLDGDEWVIRLDHGFFVTTERGPGKAQPREGNTVRVYGMLPHYARGVFINGQKAYYTNPAAYEEIKRAEEALSIDDHAKTGPLRDARIAALPLAYTEWIHHLRDTEEAATVVEREDAWVFVAEEASILVLLLKDDASLETVESILNHRSPEQGPGTKRVIEVVGFTSDERAAESVGLGAADCPMPTPEQRESIMKAAKAFPRLSALHDETTLRYALSLARAFITNPESMKDIVPWPSFGLPRVRA